MKNIIKTYKCGVVRFTFSTLPNGNSNSLNSVIYENADTQKVSILKTIEIRLVFIAELIN
jgi:hypothetical protein